MTITAGKVEAATAVEVAVAPLVMTTTQGETTIVGVLGLPLVVAALPLAEGIMSTTAVDVKAAVAAAAAEGIQFQGTKTVGTVDIVAEHSVLDKASQLRRS